jgi:hypothetical protein
MRGVRAYFSSAGTSTAAPVYSLPIPMFSVCLLPTIAGGSNAWRSSEMLKAALSNKQRKVKL